MSIVTVRYATAMESSRISTTAVGVAEIRRVRIAKKSREVRSGGCLPRLF